MTGSRGEGGKETPMRATTMGPARAFAIYLAGLVAGVQSALYLSDYYDDGVADWRSGAVAVVMIALGVGFVLRQFTRRAETARG